MSRDNKKNQEELKEIDTIGSNSSDKKPPNIFDEEERILNLHKAKKLFEFLEGFQVSDSFSNEISNSLELFNVDELFEMLKEDHTILFDLKKDITKLFQAAIKYRISKIANSLANRFDLASISKEGDFVDLVSYIDYEDSKAKKLVNFLFKNNFCNGAEELGTSFININEKNEKGDTALIACVRRENNVMVHFLLEGGANPTIKDNTNKDALDIAHENSELISAILLLDYRNLGEVEEKEPSLASLFIKALAQMVKSDICDYLGEEEDKKTYLDSLKELVTQNPNLLKAKANIAGIKGVTLLSLAVDQANREVISLLIEHGADFTKIPSDLFPQDFDLSKAEEKKKKEPTSSTTIKVSSAELVVDLTQQDKSSGSCFSGCVIS